MPDVFNKFLGRDGERDMKYIEEYEEEDYECDLKEKLLAKGEKGELKPCPFCGSDVELKHYKANGNDWWYIACRHCGIAVDPWMWNSHQTQMETIEK